MASSSLLPVLLSSSLLLSLANAATFTVTNQCSYTVWAAASTTSPTDAPALSGGTPLNSGQTWTVDVSAGTKGGRIWGRTGCSFDSNGNGKCDTGDCGKLVCNSYGSAPNTLAEFSLNQAYNLDYNDISLVDGFNVPMNYIPASGCSSAGSHCSADVNANCPSQLKTTGGCLNPCQVYKTYEYCCNPPGAGSCEPTMYSEYFKNLCPRLTPTQMTQLQRCSLVLAEPITTLCFAPRSWKLIAGCKN